MSRAIARIVRPVHRNLARSDLLHRIFTVFVLDWRELDFTGGGHLARGGILGIGGVQGSRRLLLANGNWDGMNIENKEKQAEE